MPDEKLKIPRIVFYDSTEINEYFNEDNVEVLLDILQGIEQGYNMKLAYTEIFEVEISESKDVLSFTLKEEEWLVELQNILDSFIRLEDYENADEAHKLLKKVQKRINKKNSV
jgi:hypothetical protein